MTIRIIMQNDHVVAASTADEWQVQALAERLEAEAVAYVRLNHPERARYCPNNMAGYWRVYAFEDACQE